MDALIIVDVQTDFLPGGALAVGKGDAIIEPILSEARAHDIVLTSQDWHPLEHCSFREDPSYEDGSWPAHCVQGTAGAALHPKIQALDVQTFLKGADPQVEAYSAFAGYTDAGVGLEAWLLDRDCDSVTIVGLAFEHCVRATALDAASKGWPTTVLMDCTRPVSERDAKQAKRELLAAGVILR